MPRLATTVLAGGLSVLMCFTTVIPAQAFTVPNPSLPRSSDVEQVRYMGHHGGHWHGHHFGHSRYYDHRYYGHYHHHHHHNDAWIPLAAFAAGALIAGAASQPTYHAYGNRHVRWCASQYRSYRASDDTFQPYHGPRQRCISP